jgi:transcriptional/translational regulatory protein YebC/TACO1
VLGAVKALGVEPETAQVAMLPQTSISLAGTPAPQMVRLLDLLEEHDDTTNIWSNYAVAEIDIAASLA